MERAKSHSMRGEKIILLCGRPDTWKENCRAWSDLIKQDNVLAYGKDEMREVGRPDFCSHSADTEQKIRSHIVGSALAILSAAPPEKIIADKSSHTVQWAKSLKLQVREMEGIAESSTVAPGRRNRTTSSWSQWWRQNDSKVSEMVRSAQLELKVMPPALAAVIKRISKTSTQEANDIFNREYRPASDNGRTLTGCYYGWSISSIGELRGNRHDYNKIKHPLKNHQSRSWDGSRHSSPLCSTPTDSRSQSQSSSSATTTFCTCSTSAKS